MSEEQKQTPAPKLTPLPDLYAGMQDDSVWLSINRKAVEQIIARQEQRMHNSDNARPNTDTQQ